MKPDHVSIFRGNAEAPNLNFPHITAENSPGETLAALFLLIRSTISSDKRGKVTVD